MDKVVSVIVPIYNVYAYLMDCVESLKKQTYRHIEILLIDDGSTDGSAELCDILQRTDRRIFVYHKKNGGVGSARNYGIAKAVGSYQMFVDADDWLDKNAIELLVDRLEQSGADVCYCNKYYKNDKQLQIATSVSQCDVVSVTDLIKLHVSYGFIASPCLSLADRSKVKGVKFREDIYTLEDWEYNFRILMSVNSVSILEIPYYHYRSVVGSASQSPLNNRKLTCFKIVKTVDTEIDKHLSTLRNFKACVPSFLIYHMLVAYANNGEMDGAGKQLKLITRHYLFLIICSSQVGIKYKIYAILACYSLKLFSELYHLKNK